MAKVIPLVVDKNDDNGNYVSSSEAKLFVNDEPIARTLTCKCGGGKKFIIIIWCALPCVAEIPNTRQIERQEYTRIKD